MSTPFPLCLDVGRHHARERSRAAADRTLMAWIRTALALIGFGFTIGKFYDYLETAHLHETLDPIRSTLLLGGSFILLGTLALLAAIAQHRYILKRLEQGNFAYAAVRPIAMSVAIALLLMGALAFVGIVL